MFTKISSTSLQLRNDIVFYPDKILLDGRRVKIK